MRHLSLFSGSGIGTLAAQAAGIETVAHVENEPACVFALRKLWPGVPCFEDVKEFGREQLERLGRIDIISGGFPCQPFSTAGKGKGEADSRWLWPEFARIIGLTRPSFVVAENVPGIRRKSADRIVCDLGSLGYSVGIFNLPAGAFGMRHGRKRFWFLAHSIGDRLSRVQMQNREAEERRDAATEPLAIPAWARGLGTLLEVPRHHDGLAGALPRGVGASLLRCVGNGWAYPLAVELFRAIVKIDASATDS